MREAMRRAMFTAYVGLIIVGLVYFIVLGLLQR
jgi:hypothetical protein